MMYWNRMFPRIDHEMHYYRGHDFKWYSLDLSGELSLRKAKREKQMVNELVFDNKRQPQPLFVCSRYKKGPDSILLRKNEFIFKDSMVYLGESTYAVFPRQDTNKPLQRKPERYYKRGLIIKKTEGKYAVLNEFTINMEIKAIGQICAQFELGKATHLVFT